MNNFISGTIGFLILFASGCGDQSAHASVDEEQTQNVDTPIAKHKIGEKAEIEVIDLTSEVPLYVVIAGAYSSSSSAEKKVEVLKKAGFSNADVIQRPGSKLYSALVERFDSESAAKTFATQIASNKEIKSFVYKLDD